jgi:hypothetical protein
MVEQFIRGIAKWPDDDRRAIALALVRKLSLTDLAEVLAAAHTRIHREAEKREAAHGKRRVSKAAR